LTFRRRLVLGLAAAGIVPLLLVGIGARREMARRLAAQADARGADLIGVMQDDLARDRAEIRARLAALAGDLANDNRFRQAALDRAADREWILDWAPAAMRTTGLAMLQLQDEDGRVLSSGHFRNEYEQVRRKYRSFHP
jgi:hypothetical protein